MTPTWRELLTALLPLVEQATTYPCALRVGETPADGWPGEKGGCGSSWVSVIMGTPTASGCDALLQVEVGFTRCGRPTIDNDGRFPDPAAETAFNQDLLDKAEALLAVVSTVSRQWQLTPREDGDFGGLAYTFNMFA